MIVVRFCRQNKRLYYWLRYPKGTLKKDCRGKYQNSGAFPATFSRCACVLERLVRTGRNNSGLHLRHISMTKPTQSPPFHKALFSQLQHRKWRPEKRGQLTITHLTNAFNMNKVFQSKWRFVLIKWKSTRYQFKIRANYRVTHQNGKTLPLT